MLLRELLDDAVADTHADLSVLAATSRKRGVTIRRHRRLVTAAGSLAAAATLAVVAHALVPADDGQPAPIATDLPPPATAGLLSGETLPSTSRGTAAALAAAINEVAEGRYSTFQGGDDYEHEEFAALRFLPTAGSGPAGLVQLNVQPLAMAGEPPYDCTGLEHLKDCVSRRLPTGDVLRTYRDADDEMGDGSERLAAELISVGRHLRIVVGASNTNPDAAGEHRDAAVLTTEQLIAVATQPWWSRHQLPVEFVDAGSRLDDYSNVATDWHDD